MWGTARPNGPHSRRRNRRSAPSIRSPVTPGAGLRARNIGGQPPGHIRPGGLAARHGAGRRIRRGQRAPSRDAGLAFVRVDTSVDLLEGAERSIRVPR